MTYYTQKFFIQWTTSKIYKIWTKIIQTLDLTSVLLKCFSLIFNANFLHQTEQNWYYLIVYLNVSVFIKLSDIIKINLFWQFNSWVCHILLPFSKLQRINCDNVWNVEGVWINFILTVLLFKPNFYHHVIFVIFNATPHTFISANVM